MSISTFFKSLFNHQDKALKVSSGNRLLAPHKKKLAEIRSTVGVPAKYWGTLYLNTLIHLAEYIQELPASEAHHHSGRGGLLAHTLETVLISLRIRRGKLLPPNSDAETVTKYKDVWTYAVFTAAICHDLGKPITDVSVEVLDKSKNRIGTWSPFKGPMTIYKEAFEYRIQYRRNRIYASHERASALYLHHIIPPVGIEWIASNPELFYYWTNVLTGHSEDTGVIGSIIHEADKLSVATNLAGDQVQSQDIAASTSRKPLHNRIMTSLRYQIDEGMLPLNRDGAAGWIVDDRLWVVVKRALDQVRDHMTQEGQSGIPGRNDRIMDELQQYGILIPNGDKAVWKCQVFAPDWPKAHELTLLCLPVDKVWASADAVPETFTGTITPLNSSEAPDSQESIQETQAKLHQQDPNNETQQPKNTNEPLRQMDSPEKAKAIKPPTLDFSSFATPSDTQPEAIKKEPGASIQIVDEHKDLESRPDQSPHKDLVKPDIESSQPDGQAGEDFIRWLRNGLHERKIKVNDVNSKIHMTTEGLLLVSPAIFREFDQGKWSYVQKRFTKLKLHERNSNGTNIHEYLATGKKKKSLIKGFLITDTANVFPGIELPKTNHALSKVEV